MTLPPPQDPPALRPQRVTAADVARAAGVSRSAVSRAFTAGTYLDKGKRARILQVAADLGYRPNALAAGLQGKGRSNLVAIVTGNIQNYYDSEILALLIRELTAMGKWPVVLEGGDDIPGANIMGVLNFPLDAMILRGGSVPEGVAEQCAKLRIPLIVSGRVLQSPGIDSVCCDNALGSEMAIKALIAKGRRKIAYLGGQSDLSSEQERRAGFLEAMEKAGLSPVALATGDYRFEGGRARAGALLRDHPDLDAIYCANDAMALGAMTAATHDFNRSVPESLSIIGFDDISMAGWPAIALSTIRNDISETVRQIMTLLAARLAEPDRDPQVVRIRPAFVARGTH